MAKATYTETLYANNAALTEMNRVLGLLETQFQRTTKVTKQANEVSEKANKLALTRGQASAKLVEKLKDEGKELNLISSNLSQTRKNFSEFRDIVGVKGKIGSVVAGIEYFDLILSSSSQRIKIFGFEAATARKIMYGFLPPGMFRAVNKVSTSLRAGSVALRQLAGEGEEANNIFTTLGKASRKINIGGAFESIGSNRERRKAAKEERMSIYRRGRSRPIGRHGHFRLKQLDKTIKETGIISGNETFQRRKEQFKSAGKAVFNKVIAVKRATIEGFITARVHAKRMWRDRNWKAFVKRIKKSLNPVDALLKLIKTPVMQFLITGLMYLTGIALVIVLLRKTVWPALKEAFKAVKDNLGLLILGFQTIFGGLKEVFTGLINGDLMMMIDGILEIGLGLLQVVLGILWVSAVGLWTLAKEIVVNFFSGVGDFFYKALTDFEFLKKNMGKIALGVVAAIAFFVSLPAALTALGVIVIFRGLKWIWGKISGLGFLSSGGLANNGMAVVGERGPELVSLPAGSRVHSNSNSKRMMGGTVTNFNITINAKDSSKAEMRRMADEIGRMINSKINRSTSSSTLR